MYIHVLKNVLSFKPPSFLHIFHDHPEDRFFHPDWPYLPHSFCDFSLFVSDLFRLTAQRGHRKPAAFFIVVQIPLQAEYYALEGVSQLMNTISMVKQHLNPNLVIEGVVITMYDGRANVSRQITAEIKKFFKNKLYEIIIPRNIRLSEAPSHGKPIMLYDSKCVGARAYKALVEEFLSKQ